MQTQQKNIINQNTSSRSQAHLHDCEGVITTSVEILSQLETGLSALTDHQYATSVEDNISSIGGHTRHIVEFYQALLNTQSNTQKATAPSILCYDNRQRDMTLETSKDAVLHELTALKQRLSNLPRGNTEIQLDAIINSRMPMFAMNTTLHRELFYLLDHTIHHMALIKMLAKQHGVIFDRNFGLAQSTKAHETTKG